MEIERIGAYVVERKIGAGGMGTVFLAKHSETGQPAAVKVLSAALSREEGFVERFNREVDALKRLKNSHVVELYESGVDGDVYYYAMEYVDGETVTDRLRREKRIPWREVIDIGVQVCSALKAAHDAGIIHRDLKPSNLILASDGTVKLTDFGIAQLFAASKLTATGGIVGTPEYMSPEQSEGKRATRKSDLYSLGALMYVMLTGRPPYTGKTSLDVIMKHRFGQFDRPRSLAPDIPHWLEEVVCQLMEKDPDKRYPDAYVTSLRLKEIPKKVELSTESISLSDDSFDGSATTVAAPMKGQPAPERGPGPGTIMHSLMRAEVDRQSQPTPIGQLFNNTWFLVSCLLLVVGGGIWWFQSMQDSPELEAPAAVAAGTETTRFLELARHQQRLGDFARAERILHALCTLLEDNPEQQDAFRHAQNQLQLLRANRAEKEGRLALLKESQKRAKRLADAGQNQKASEICESLLELYGTDPSVTQTLQESRRLLDELRTQTSKPSAETTSVDR